MSFVGSGGRRAVAVAIAGGASVVAIAVVALIWAATGGATGSASAHPSTHPSASVRPGYAGGIQEPAAAPSVAPAGSPVRITIPQIGADSGLEDLHTDATGKLLPPAKPGVAGWYGAGVVPGQVGPAIIAGHIDYAAGPGIFERLHELTVGSTVQVTMSTGAVLNFRVTGSTQSAKVAFPTAEVYGITPDPQLRLISCAGQFDRRTAHYLDNLVVFAVLVP